MGRRSREKKQRVDEAPPDDGGPRLVGLETLVFTAGAVLMGLEVTGSRILAPHFGNSVFVWGSLISVVLTALAAGYFEGGKLADRRPSYPLLLALTSVAAALILLVPAFGHPICRALASVGFGERSGPLVGSLLLFLPPSFLMGMVSPFAVRLGARSMESVGRVAGTLYAVSTLGSIFGTLLTTFVLIPFMGTVLILKALGAVLVTVPALLYFLHARNGGAAAAAVVVAVVGLALPSAPADALLTGEVLVFETESPYHHIRVIDVQGRYRFMKFDRFYEGGIELSPPHRTMQPYTDYFELAFLVQPRIERALFIGTGAGTGVRSFLAENPDMRIDVVDVDAEVIAAAESQFHMPRLPNVESHPRDGRAFLSSGALEGGYDAIIVDAFTVGGRIPFHMVTREFFALCASRLRPGGALVMNVNGTFGSKGNEIYLSAWKTLSEVFPRLYPFATRARDQAQAIIVVGHLEDVGITPDEWTARASRFEMKSRVTQNTIEKMAADLVWPPPDVNGAVLFTDDYVPVETMPLAF